ncbi:alpha/beta hydrolase fold domain-containing protein [Pseudonocardia sp. ICBG1142]|uniref:alpha/beta hydrolase fold domain-containing protein n=1 Tax=Pseudonocardia sp. ICBG1142 TaxID=2846760 RepID=UPI001CF63EE0|nr:alpha/beta hydrolase fold domain-containing protein [Pseudonocardia sp. ICBG1142]
MSTDAVVPTRAPGRLGNPSMTIGDDPRADPRMVAVLEGFGLTGHADDAPLDRTAGRPALLGFVDAAEEGFEGFFAALSTGWAPMSGIDRTTRTVPGADGHEITLYVHRPTGVDGPLPVIYQVHGGGMVMLAAEGPLYVRWRDELAAEGAVVVGVEYRNGGGRLGSHPFPAGLDDCVTGLHWVHEHLTELGGTHVVVTGDSGGANLALGLAVRARRDGWAGRIAGVYAQCPYVLGSWDRAPADLASPWENDRYWLNRELFPLLAEVYDPGSTHAEDPTCWAAAARAEDLHGLPPHVIACAELDPLRDEGLAHHRRLLAAGVPSVGLVYPGLCHVGMILFRDAMPDVYAHAVRDVVGFARSVRG